MPDEKKKVVPVENSELIAEIDRILGKLTSIEERLTNLEAKSVPKSKSETVINAKVY